MLGFSRQIPNSYFREYEQKTKVFPQKLFFSKGTYFLNCFYN